MTFAALLAVAVLWYAGSDRYRNILAALEAEDAQRGGL